MFKPKNSLKFCRDRKTKYTTVEQPDKTPLFMRELRDHDISENDVFCPQYLNKKLPRSNILRQ